MFESTFSCKIPTFLSFESATDLNPTAAKTTAKCAEHNKAPPINVITTNLADCLKERIDNMVDVLIFNPPYVPTSDREVRSVI